MSQLTHASQPRQTVMIAFTALVVGAVAMGMSPIFVRFADVGPFTSAFWRAFLSIPALYLWALYDERGKSEGVFSGWNGWVMAAGAFFAGDLFFWHLSIVNTTVANATFFATLAPAFVVFVTWAFLKEQVSRQTLVGVMVCVAGGGLLIGSSFQIAPERLEGDVYGLITAFFFGSYIIVLGFARSAGISAGKASFQLTIICAAILIVPALLFEDQLFPATRDGWLAVLALALITHVGGQGLLAYALGTLPASYSSLVMFLEGVAAAALGWIILGEHLTLIQVVGATAIFFGVFYARPRKARSPEGS